jgi:hypothetical protein
LTLREEHRLKMFDSRVLRKIFGPKRDGVMGWWRKLHKEDLRDLYSSPRKIRIIKSSRLRWAGHVERMGEKRNVYSLMVGETEGNLPPGEPRRRCVVIIKIDLVETEWDGVNWIGLVRDRECGNEPPGSLYAGKLLSGYTAGGLSISVQLHR